MDKISTFISTYFDWFYITVPGTVDIIEILICHSLYTGSCCGSSRAEHGLF